MSDRGIMKSQLELLQQNSREYQHLEPNEAGSREYQHLEQRIDELEKQLNKKKFKRGSGIVDVYSPSKKLSSYYRYSYWNGRKTAHKHIKGGAVGNPLVEKRADIIRQMIARSATVFEILNIISAFT